MIQAIERKMTQNYRNFDKIAQLKQYSGEKFSIATVAFLYVEQSVVKKCNIATRTYIFGLI